ncbi:hypothetical protein BLOT_004288 [Blomia tropicalis]|nr:hypothetical protein BLOT_004288 [Blomia tropicalis]
MFSYPKEHLKALLHHSLLATTHLVILLSTLITIISVTKYLGSSSAETSTKSGIQQSIEKMICDMCHHHP